MNDRNLSVKILLVYELQNALQRSKSSDLF